MQNRPPVVEKAKRTPAHERAIRRAWEHRRQARLQRSIAADHMRMREQVQEELRATDKRLSFYQDMANTALYERNELQREVATLKSRPHHMGQPVAMDDYQRLARERDEARTSLASRDEKCRQLTHALDRGSDMLEMMTERALRAENALRAVEARRERTAIPYRANVQAVTFGAAA